MSRTLLTKCPGGSRSKAPYNEDHEIHEDWKTKKTSNRRDRKARRANACDLRPALAGRSAMATTASQSQTFDSGRLCWGAVGVSAARGRAGRTLSLFRVFRGSSCFRGQGPGLCELCVLFGETSERMQRDSGVVHARNWSRGPAPACLTMPPAIVRAPAGRGRWPPTSTLHRRSPSAHRIDRRKSV